MIIFGMFLVGAFLLQGFLCLFQVKNFSKNFSDLRQNGNKVLVGKNPHRLQAGSLMLLALNNKGIIIDAKIMKGITVFAKFKSIPRLAGQYLAVVATDNQILHQYDRLTRQCLQNAYKNYVDFQTGNLDKKEFDTGVNVFTIPVFTQLHSWSLNLYKKIKHRKSLIK